MKWLFVLVSALALTATACSDPPAPPRGWSVDREAPAAAAGNETAVAVCEDMHQLALGDLAEETELGPTLEELARISAVVGATDALPILNRVSLDLADGATLFAVHDGLVAAAAAIDPATYALCRLPVFTATYATTGWPGCHGELVIPVAGYTVIDPDRGCSNNGAPSFIPCFADELPHLPVDCNDGTIVQVVDGEWVPAGEPRVVAPPTTTTTQPEITETTTTTTTIPSLGYTPSAACRSVAALFTGADPVTGTVEDLDRLDVATGALGAAIRALVDDFIALNTGDGNLDDFDATVLALDQATADMCGLPVISAWDALAGGAEELPCWVETGLAFPAYTPAECT